MTIRGLTADGMQWVILTTDHAESHNGIPVMVTEDGRVMTVLEVAASDFPMIHGGTFQEHPFRHVPGSPEAQTSFAEVRQMLHSWLSAGAAINPKWAANLVALESRSAS